MRSSLRITSVVSSIVLLAGLAACGAQPLGGTAPMGSYPTSTYPAATYPASSYPAGNVNPAYVEYGRVTNIEVIRTQGTVQGTGAGAIIGGIAGGVIGNQVGGGTGRDVARIAGVVGGALAGNAIEKNTRTPQVNETYRISVQTDNGARRSYDLASSGDLRPGDRVRIENGQLFRY
jgi:outer membrane lipoprotein SlyB